MDEMIRYIFGSLRCSETAMRVFAKTLRKQMITIDVAEYCSACMDFDPDVQRPQKAYGMSEEIVISDTVIRCSNRNRCKNIERYLRKKVTDDGVGKTDEAMP